MPDFFVFDTNVLVSALLFKSSKPTQAYEKAKELGQIVISPDTYAELQEVLLRPKFDKYIPFKKRSLFLEKLLKTFVFVQTSEPIIACRDPKDNKFLELAVAAKASCIITGDIDLLVLNPFRKIPILNASDFLVKF
ncbi:MAG TPA: putative toxin-antitoxin system toxin component, PIN family [Salinimicrobium sp.]|nr:putative toxin-antitoxin system toxin component, PIN family [Salinimicrobium sp.]